MANFKTNEVVEIKATGQKGIIKAREVTRLNNKRNKVEYIVRLAEGFENWKSFSGKEIRKINKKPNVYNGISKFYKLDNGYVLCMVAETHVIRDSTYWYDEYAEPHFMDYKNKELRIGYSICNPHDEFSEEQGIKIARHRLKTSPFCHIVSRFTGEFNKETIEALINVKANYIMQNIDRFIKK